MIAYKVFWKDFHGKLQPIMMDNQIDFIDPKKYIIQRADNCGPFQCYRSYAGARFWSGEVYKVRIKKSAEQKLVWIDPMAKKAKYDNSVILADEFEILEEVK